MAPKAAPPGMLGMCISTGETGYAKHTLLLNSLPKVSLPHYAVLMRFSSPKMLQIQNFSGLCPGPRWGSLLTALSQTPWLVGRWLAPPTKKPSPALVSHSAYPHFIQWHRLHVHACMALGSSSNPLPRTFDTH